AIVGETRLGDFDVEYRPRRMSAAVIFRNALDDSDVGLWLGIVVESDRSFPAHVPTSSERGLESPSGLDDCRVVRGTLRLGDHQLAADELDLLARPENAEIDQAVILSAAEAARSRLV